MATCCGTCGAVLVSGPGRSLGPVTRGEYTAELRNLPRLVCPAGCPTTEVPLQEMLLEVLALGKAMVGHVAKRRGILPRRSVCPRCASALAPVATPHTFTFLGSSGEGMPLELVVTGPALECPTCCQACLPHDAGTRGLNEATSGVMQ